MPSVLSIPIGGNTYPMPATAKALEKVGRMWRKNARISLRKQDRINTGTLYDSIPVDVYEQGDNFIVDITPQVPYWEFVDKGVQGASRNIFPDQASSPFKFGSGKGPKGLRGAIDRWVVQRGLEGTRDEKGRFISRRSMTFLITRAIWTRGLKPALFITRTKKNIQKHVVKTIAPAISKDMANAMRIELNN